jgi:hypothetical protein
MSVEQAVLLMPHRTFPPVRIAPRQSRQPIMFGGFVSFQRHVEPFGERSDVQLLPGRCLPGSLT